MPKSKLLDVELIAGLEQRLLNVWPALRTDMIDGWAVRFAGGYTGRANSASAIQTGAMLHDELFSRIIKLYADANLPPQFRVSPVAHQDTAKFLRDRGLVSRGLAHTMISHLDGADVDPRVELTVEVNRQWCVDVTSRQEESKQRPDAMFAIINGFNVPHQFATLRVNGKAVGFGMAAIDRGWVELGSIMIDQQHRGCGLGRAVVSTLLQWASKQNASRAFLQVDTTNATAIGLYESIGFEVLYDYDTVAMK